MFFNVVFLLLFSTVVYAQMAQDTPLPSEWDSLGCKLELLLNERSVDIDYYFAARAFWKRLIINNPKNENVRQFNEELLADASKFHISSIFVKGEEQVKYKFLHSRADSILVIQQRLDEVEFNYLFFKLDYFANDWKVVDIYFLVYDTYLSSLLKNTVYFPVVFEALERDNAATILENSRIYREAKHLYGEGDIKLAYLKLSGIPLEERLKEYQVYKIFLSTKIEDDKKLLRSVKEYYERFKDDKSLPLLFLDYYLITERYDLAMEAVERIDSTVGGDNYLQFYRGLIHHLKGNWKTSGAILEEAVLNTPEEEYYVAFLTSILVKERAYRWAVQVFEKLVKTEYYEKDELREWAKLEYPELVRSKPFKRWLRKR